MDRIEKYLRKLTNRLRAGRGAAEADELLEEVRGHLRESVDELRREGRSERESVAIALERFGDGKRLNGELRQALSQRRTGRSVDHAPREERQRQSGGSRLTKRLAAAAMSLLLLSLLCFVGWAAIEHRNTRDFDGMQQSVRDRLESRLAEGKPITEADLSGFYRENSRVLRFVQFEQTDGDGQTTTSFIQPGTAQDELGVQPYYIRQLDSREGERAMAIRIGLDRDELWNPISPVLLKGAAVCVALYWLTYALWGMAVAKRAGRLNAGWAVLFLTLNVIGYLLFSLTGKARTGRLLAWL